MSTKYPVRAGETGAIRGDGSGTRTFTTTPKTPGHNVTTNAARHATGQQLARVGNQRGGQSEPASNKVQTGARPEMTPRPSIRADQAQTSRDAEARLLAAPQPFTYDGAAATAPTGRHDGSTEGVRYNVAAGVNAKPQTYGSPVMSEKEMMEAVGYSSGATKSSNPIITGQPTKNNQRQAGKPGSRNANTSGRENNRMRQGS